MTDRVDFIIARHEARLREIDAELQRKLRAVKQGYKTPTKQIRKGSAELVKKYEESL